MSILIIEFNFSLLNKEWCWYFLENIDLCDVKMY